MTVVTTGMIREIRRRRDNETLATIAADLGLHYNTVWKYSTDQHVESTVQREKRYLDRIRADPEKMARRRETALRYKQQLRDA